METADEVELTAPVDVSGLIARLRRGNANTTKFERKRATGSNKYMRAARSKDGSASWISPFKDVFGDDMALDADRFEQVERPDPTLVLDCDRTVFDACDELMRSINPGSDLTKMVMLEVRDKYVSNVMPRIVMLVCPDNSMPSLTLENVIGIKDNGTVCVALCDEGNLQYDGPAFTPLRQPNNTETDPEAAAAVVEERRKAVSEILLNVWGKEMWMDALDTQFAQISKGVLEHYLDYEGIFQTDMKSECKHLMEEFKQRTLYTDMDRTAVNPMKVWSTWDDKKVYKKALYDPSRPVLDQGGDVFNLFTGWGVEPTAPRDPDNPCPHIMRHGFEVMSSSSKPHWRFWLDALATWVRNPATKLECAFVCACAKGVGKGAWWEVFKRMWGIHSVEIVDMNHLTGRFNSHLKGKSALGLNEACWGGSHQANSKLLSIITDKDFLEEAKHGKPSMMVNHWVVFVMGNATWSVPATVDNRRFFIPTISECHRGDKAYFDAYHASLDVEVPEFLYYLLHTHKITPGFRPGSAIQAMGNTDAGVGQVTAGNAAFLTKWVKHGLEAGALKVGHDPTFTKSDGDDVDYSKEFHLFDMDKPTVVSSSKLVALFEKELECNSKLRKAENQFLVQRSIDKNMLSRMFASLFGPTKYKHFVWRKDAKDPETGKNTAYWFATVDVLRTAFAKTALNAPTYTWPDAEPTPEEKVSKAKELWGRYVRPMAVKSALQRLALRWAFRDWKGGPHPSDQPKRRKMF